MTENKRFERVYGDIEVVCIDHDSTSEDRFFDDGDYDKFVKSLNELNEENEQLIKDNFELQGLLGDVRALLRLGKVDDAIGRIDKFERSMKK